MCEENLIHVFFPFVFIYLQESEILKLENAITNVRKGNFAEESDELNKLVTENSKLKFRLEILNQVSKF